MTIVFAKNFLDYHLYDIHIHDYLAPGYHIMTTISMTCPCLGSI